MKILICDDDKSTIGVLKKNIDFTKYGIDEVLEAYNGEMAIKAFDEHNPEFVLCDIGMPKVNGIEVLMHIKTKNPITEFCFLTCYENFEYAHKAIEYEASGYITKPFKLEQIESMLSKMLTSYNKHNPSVQDIQQANRDLLYQRTYKIIADGIYGTDKDLINNYLKMQNINFVAEDKYKIVLTCINTLESVNSSWSKELLILIAPRMHDEVFNNYSGMAHSFLNMDDRFLWCVTFVKEEDSEDIQEKCNSLSDFCYEHFQTKPVMLISDTFEFYKTADVACELYDTMRKIRYYGGKIFHQNDDISKLETDIVLDQNQVLWYIKNRDSKGYEEYINRALCSQTYIENIEKFKKELFLFYLTLLKDNNLDEKILFDNKEIVDANKLEANKKNALILAKSLLEVYINEISVLLNSEDIISRAKKFVDDNYRNNIDRDDVAEVAFVTPNYLSKLFKNNIGMNLREYINKLRVEESKRLLLSTNMSITEIAMFVGYYNISYFSTIFHKLVGVSPADWRNNKGE